jgi:hypothetical protein
MLQIPVEIDCKRYYYHIELIMLFMSIVNEIIIVLNRGILPGLTVLADELWSEHARLILSQYRVDL